VKKLALAALLAVAATSADAAVTISFTGDAAYGSYVRTYTGSDSFAYDAGTPTVSGKITIDTAAIGANQATAPGAYYDGGGAAFLTGSFFSTGATPLLSGSVVGQLITSDPDFGTASVELYFETIDPDGFKHSSVFTLTSNSALPAITVGGILLPDFSQATDLTFLVTNQEGPNDNYVETYSSGYVTSVAIAAVPEPASWAMMVSGFGLVGGVLRRRQRVALAA
jgi:hypothetical protein